MGRRTAGTGSIRRLASGRWQARVTDTATGAQVAVGAWRTKAEAERAVAQAQLDQVRGEWQAPSRETLGEWLGAWVEDLPGRRQSTKVRYRWAVGHICACGGAIRMTELTGRRVQGIIDRLSTRGLGHDSVRYVVAVLRTALRDAERAEVVRRAPKIVMPKGPERDPMRCLTRREVEALSVAVDQRYRAMIELACWCGLRIGELVALEWGDVDIERQLLRVDRQATEVAGHLVWGPPKTSASRRTIHLPAFVALSIDEHRRAAPWGDAPTVWRSQRGGVLRAENWRRSVLRPALAAAGIDGRVRIHDLRHTAAALAIAAGVQAKHLQAMLGHASIGITMDVYGHLYPDDRQAAAALERFAAAR